MKINLREGGENSDVLTIMIHISRLRFVIVSPRLLHCIYIDCPSKRWSIDGLTMEYRWSIFGGRAKTDAGNDGGFFVLCPTKICALYLKLEGLSGRNNAVLT